MDKTKTNIMQLNANDPRSINTIVHSGIDKFGRIVQIIHNSQGYTCAGAGIRWENGGYTCTTLADGCNFGRKGLTLLQAYMIFDLKIGA